MVTAALLTDSRAFGAERGAPSTEEARLMTTRQRRRARERRRNILTACACIVFAFVVGAAAAFVAHASYVSGLHADGLYEYTDCQHSRGICILRSAR